MDLYYIHTFSVTVLLFQNKRFKKKKRIIENGRKNESFTAGWSIHFKILILLESVLTRGKEASRVRSPQKWSLNSIQLPGLGQNTLAFGERNWTFRKKTLNSSHRQRKDLPVLACGFIHPSLFSDRSWDLTSERTFSHWFPMLAWGLPEPGGEPSSRALNSGKAPKSTIMLNSFLPDFPSSAWPHKHKVLKIKGFH